MLTQKHIRYTVSLIVCIGSLTAATSLFAEPAAFTNETDATAGKLSLMQEQARMYRSQGISLQNAGDLNQAMSLYQKAIELDPLYVEPFNDLGVVYEAKGQIDKAEESYIRSTQVDPGFLSAYSNLALLYEGKRDLEKAALYWEKRAKLGLADDPWTKKAFARLRDINAVLGRPTLTLEEEEMIGFMKEISSQKDLQKESNVELARAYFEKAKRSYDRHKYVLAMKQASYARQLDPTHPGLDEFIEKVHIRAISEE